jgi:hypothetical protein
MKTNLLKVAGGLCFSLALLGTANVQAQTKAYENFQYTVGTDFRGVAGSGIGWAGPWDSSKDGVTISPNGFHNIVAGNLEGAIGATGTNGGQWVDSFRDLNDPVANEVGNVLWVGFTWKSGKSTSGGGATFFWGNAENLYLGRLPGGVIGIGNCWQDAACTGPQADAAGLVSVSDKHYYLAKVTAQGGDIIKIDLWADYEGTTPPLADFDLEPTYQNSGYRSSAGGIDKIRINGDTEPSEATTLYSTFDAIRMSSTFFCKNDVTLTGTCPVLPLTLTSLTAKSTTNGNAIAWSYGSNDGVKSITVLRKGAKGDFVAIKTINDANAVSYLDTNPLAGVNYYQLSSTDNDGTSTTYDLVAVANGFEIAPTFYPNPATGGVVNVVAGNDVVKSVSIFDLSGKKVASKLGAGAVNTSALAKGVYIIEITGEKSTSKSKLVVE